MGPDSLNTVDLCAVSCAMFDCFVFIEPLRNKVFLTCFLENLQKNNLKGASFKCKLENNASSMTIG